MTRESRKRKYIKEIFEDWCTLGFTGIWFSGKKGEGEYKEWYENGKLKAYALYGNGKLVKDYLV